MIGHHRFSTPLWKSFGVIVAVLEKSPNRYEESIIKIKNNFFILEVYQMFVKYVLIADLFNKY